MTKVMGWDPLAEYLGEETLKRRVVELQAAVRDDSLAISPEEQAALGSIGRLRRRQQTTELIRPDHERGGRAHMGADDEGDVPGPSDRGSPPQDQTCFSARIGLMSSSPQASAGLGVLTSAHRPAAGTPGLPPRRPDFSH